MTDLDKKNATYKADLCARFARATGVTEQAAQTSLDAWLKVLCTALHDLPLGGRVSLRGYGTLMITESLPRKYKHPQTGEVQVSKGRPRLTFRAGSHLLKSLRLE